MDSLKNFLHKVKLSSIVIALIGFIAGLVAFFRPAAVSLGLCRLVGAGLLVCAVSCVISYFTTDLFRFLKTLELVGAVLFGVAGFWILIRPEGILRFVYIILGLLLIADGIVDLQVGKISLFFGKTRIFCIVTALLSIFIGIMVILNPFGAGNTVMRFAGLMLTIGSILGGWMLYKAAKKTDDMLQQ